MAAELDVIQCLSTLTIAITIDMTINITIIIPVHRSYHPFQIYVHRYVVSHHFQSSLASGPLASGPWPLVLWPLVPRL